MLLTINFCLRVTVSLVLLETQALKDFQGQRDCEGLQVLQDQT